MFVGDFCQFPPFAAFMVMNAIVLSPPGPFVSLFLSQDNF